MRRCNTIQKWRWQTVREVGVVISDDISREVVISCRSNAAANRLIKQIIESSILDFDVLPDKWFNG